MLSHILHKLFAAEIGNDRKSEIDDRTHAAAGDHISVRNHIVIGN